MAFNPFTSFRKYQKFWMATILLVCMITFVLCTGVGGDLGDRIINLFRSREGQTYAKLDGRNLSSAELHDLKTQRNIANEFIRRACELSLKNLDAEIQAAKQDLKEGKVPEEKRKELLPEIEFRTQLRNMLDERLRRRWYFGLGGNLDNLIDFKIWVIQADRLGVNLQRAQVQEMVFDEIFGRFVQFKEGGREFAAIYRAVRSTYHNTTEAMIDRALAEEFRVRIAQLAFAEANVEGLTKRVSKEAAFIKNNVKFESRLALSPHMLWEQFREKRNEFEVALVPVRVEDFLNKATAPTKGELESTFELYRKKPFDPSLDEPGFEIPPKVKIEYVTADPTSARWLNLAKAALTLQFTPLAHAPIGGPWSLVVAYGNGNLAQKALHQQIYEARLRSPATRDNYLMGNLGEADIYSPIAYSLAKRHAEAPVSLLGTMAMRAASPAAPVLNFTAPLSFLSVAHARDAKELEGGLAAEAQKRAPKYASLVGAGAAAPGWPLALAMSGALGESSLRFLFQEPEESLLFPSYLPLDVVEQDIAKVLQRELAEKWVSKRMNELAEKLKKYQAAGGEAKRKNLDIVINDFVNTYGLERKETKEFFDRFSIDQAPELKPLLESYERYWELVNWLENRDLAPETALKEGDFYRLFFDTSEEFSAAGAKFSPRIWPPIARPKNVGKIVQTGQGKGFLGRLAPELRQLLLEADPNREAPEVNLYKSAPQPFIFWKSEELAGRFPEQITEVQKRVEDAFKFLQARDKYALPAAKKLAETAQRSQDLTGALYFAELPVPRSPIRLDHVASWTIEHGIGEGKRQYLPYSLPKGVISYPTSDMAAQILSLGELKKPVETGHKEIDTINRSLFETAQKNGKKVQILTNKPRSIFYVAGVTSPDLSGSSPALYDAFFTSYRLVYRYIPRFDVALEGPDPLLNKLQEEAGKQHQAALLEQFRRQMNFEWVADIETRKSFDTSEGT